MVIIMLLLVAGPMLGNDTTLVRTKQLVLTMGGGASTYLGIPGTPDHLRSDVSKTGSAFSARLMWYPEHLIRVGMESGLVDLYSYRIQDNGNTGSVSLRVIPLLLQWSMRIGSRVQAFAGWGTYRSISTLNYLGRSRSASYAQGYSAALSYSIPISDRFDAALEAKWMNTFVTRHHVLALQCRIDLKLAEW